MPPISCSTGGSSWEGGGAREIDVLKETDDVWAISYHERQTLWKSWLEDIRDPITDTIVVACGDFEAAKSSRNKVSHDVDLRCLQQTDIIGVTTTGLAKNLDLLQKVRCQVMLCEEAGEVLEAHALTSLLPSVQHAILIGDHLQLRPQINNYELQSTNPRGAQYSLDVSLFERLATPLHSHDPQIPFSTLETQRRMHPSISMLIRNTMYPSLEDGGPVASYPQVVGMHDRLFWLHHEVPEDENLGSESTSRTNSYEADVTVALAQHLIRQGEYGPNDIAVITPYLGQLQKLRHQMGSLFEISVNERDLDDLEAVGDPLTASESDPRKVTALGKTTLLKSVRLATVDNFQGEEAKVVIISLVRSNAENRCGFLSTSNRINVLLSRAKHGMYLIGNSHTYGQVAMWREVIGLLQQNGSFGRELRLQCPRHLDTIMPVASPDDFLRFSPEGGCSLPCDRRLSCGHSCKAQCHSESLHSAFKCLEPCPRRKTGCDHPCEKHCGETCESRCNVLLHNLSITLPCGHMVSSAQCWQAQKPETTIQCDVPVEKDIPGCGHKVVTQCHQDVTSDAYKCLATCGDALPCGHACSSPCYRCKVRKDGLTTDASHIACGQKCGRNYTTCRHVCNNTCHTNEPCPPCPAPCEVRCSHSKCSKPCHEPCAPCAEQSCASVCPHSSCTMPCAAPCNWVPCSRRCNRTLQCGHRCPSICGEQCPETNFCQTCGSDDVRERDVDFIMGMQYKDIDLDEDPCIFPDCGHFVTRSNMDGIMGMTTHYNVSDDGEPLSLAKTALPFSMDEVKTCPTCRGSLRNISRYGRIIRRVMLDEATKKFITWSNKRFLELLDCLIVAQDNLAKEPEPRSLQINMRPEKLQIVKDPGLKQFKQIQEWVGGSSDRYRPLMWLWSSINDFNQQVRVEEQPLQRVADFVKFASLQSTGTGGGNDSFIFDETGIQTKARLQAGLLLLKCETGILSDFARLRLGLQRNNNRPQIELNFTANMKSTQKLITLAHDTRHVRQEVEGHIYFAQYCGFTRELSGIAEQEGQGSQPADGRHEKMGHWKSVGNNHLEMARKLMADHPGSTVGLTDDVEVVEKMLSDGVFYAAVTSDEKKAVYEAMRAEFSGTGHWYACENGHPFTIGECGMPMEQARCPECQAKIGGQSHRPEEGVRQDETMEELGRDMDALRV